MKSRRCDIEQDLLRDFAFGEPEGLAIDPLRIEPIAHPLSINGAPAAEQSHEYVIRKPK